MVATLIRAVPDSDINAQVDFERKRWTPDAANLADYRKYLRGKQLDPRTTKQKNMFPELLSHDFCDNVCRRIVLIPANRLTIARFDVEDQRVSEFIADVRMRNRFTTLAANTNIATLRDGDHAISLAWADGALRLMREGWWDGTSGIFVAYDDFDMPTYAVKEWTETDIEGQATYRRVVWFPDRIERYRSQDRTAWELFNLPTDFPDRAPQEATAVPWLTKKEEPIGLPVVHFPNQLVPNDGAVDGSGAADSSYGMSLLSGGVLGVQDRINLVQFDIISTSSFTGTQMLWGTGVRPPIDQATKQPIPYEVVPGAMVTDGDPLAKFGAFPAGSIEAHDRALAILKESVAQMTGLPYVVLSGNWPSGEALARAEADLAELVDKFGETQGPAYASLMHKATRLANVFGNADLDEEARIATIFTHAQRSNPLAVAAQLVQLAEVEGKREALRDIGKQPEDIDRIMKELQDEGEANADALEREMNRQLSGAAAAVRQGANGAAEAGGE